MCNERAMRNYCKDGKLPARMMLISANAELPAESGEVSATEACSALAC